MKNELENGLKLRIINWNISYQGNNPKTKLLKSVINEVEHPSILALQEVSEATYRDLCENEILNDCVFSLTHRKPGVFEGKNRALGCLIAIAGDLEILESSVLERVPFPERTLSAKIRGAERVFEIVSFHSLTGIAYGRAKSAQFAAITEYLHEKSGSPVIMCGDANEPKIDHYDQDKTIYFNQKGDGGKAASLLFGSSEAHGLKDAYRIWLSKNNEEIERIKKYQKEKEKDNNLESAPLAVSHIVRGKKKRYDHLFLSQDWHVENIEYRYKNAIIVGSDHAIMVADLAIFQI